MTGAASIPITRRIYLDIDFKPTAAELEKGVVSVLFLPRHPSFMSAEHPPLRVTDAVLDRVEAKMRSTKNRIPSMYAHGKDPARGKIASGWSQNLERRPDGLHMEIKLTKRALKEVGDEEWAYVSPGLDVKQMPDGSLEPTDCFEISLTNTPMLDDQDRLAADRDGGTTMDTKKLAKLAGIAEDSSEDAILEALGKKLATPPPPTGTAGELSEKQLEVLADRLQSRLTEGILKGAEKTAEKMVEADRKERRVTALLDRAMREGKAIATDRKVVVAGKECDKLRLDCERDPDVFEEWLKHAPRKSPVGGAFPKGDGQDAVTKTEAGSFAGVDLTNPEVRMELHRAAQARVEAKKDPDYSTAQLTLTRAN